VDAGRAQLLGEWRKPPAALNLILGLKAASPATPAVRTKHDALSDEPNIAQACVLVLLRHFELTKDSALMTDAKDGAAS